MASLGVTNHRKPVNARHRGDGGCDVLALDDENRPDQVVDGQHVFAHQPARPVRLAVAARTMGKDERKIERMAGVGRHGGVP